MRISYSSSRGVQGQQVCERSAYIMCCGSVSAWMRNLCLDPELVFRIRFQQKMKEQKNKYFIFSFRPVNFGLCVL